MRASPSPRRLALALLAVALIAAAASAAGIPVRGAYGGQTTADEPHYLLTAISLAEDGDLDVRDELASGRFRPFHESDLPAQARPGEDGRLVEPHDPLLPALLAAPMALGGWVGAKLALAALAGVLAALTLWIAVRRLEVPLGPAGATVALFSASAPLAAYGSQVYPELPAALCVAVAIAALTGPLRRAGLAALAASLVALPWLATKYAPVAAALAAVGLWRLARSGRLRGAVGLAVGLGLAGAVFLAAHRALYGGWTPYAAGSHFAADGELSVVGSDPDYLGRSRRLVGLLVDQDFGLAAWQPAWLIAVPAVGALLARRPPGWAALAAPLGAAWLVATFAALTMQGWWFPGRQAVVALPAAVLVVAWWAGRAGPRLAALAAAGAVGVATWAWLVVEGTAGGLAWAVDLAESSAPWYRAWRTVLPDYLEVTAATWALHWAWAAAAVAALVLAARREGRPRLRGRRLTVAPRSGPLPAGVRGRRAG
jgi:hypothetical protein